MEERIAAKGLLEGKFRKKIESLGRDWRKSLFDLFKLLVGHTPLRTPVNRLTHVFTTDTFLTYQMVDPSERIQGINKGIKEHGEGLPIEPEKGSNKDPESE